ncbi:GspE/PulE family protein [Chromobacterium haemolyticum]|uniref:GspE/PulE family protein n=1 Tax=Chromobacterium haemolyticum TaxID=394935 RepID=UPI00190F1956|nr:GspE/PulE family protein [Chromobacterium haemolyticum]
MGALMDSASPAGWQWRRESGEQDLPMAELLSRQLEREPGSLPLAARLLGLAALSEAQVGEAAARFDLLPLAEALSCRAAPLEWRGGLYLVMAEPLRLDLRLRLQNRLLGGEQRFAICLPGVVDAWLKQAEARERVMDGAEVDLAEDSLAKAVESISLTSLAKDESPVIRLVNMTLYDALQSHASDIHLESRDDGLQIRYRIDGVMQSIRQVPGQLAASQTMSRLKVLSCLDIAEKRVPQDGRFKVALQGREVDFRVSIMPGAHGENAVLRLLDKSQRGDSLNLDSLGFHGETARRVRALAQLPYGLTLITGPTGSGKSTTLYGALAEINTGEEKIITIEDPVEYEMAGILQIPVNEKKGLTFARGLRSILRHDPDTILVGEIRDAETAAIAVQSALTGHRVLSSVHANDAFSVIDRFLYMGVEAATFLEALNGVVSQRLVRRLCVACAGAGCDHCRGGGFHGRIALAEVLRLDSRMKDALLERSPQKRQQALAQCADYQSLRDAAREAVARGLTTYQEVSRAVAME